MKDYNNSIEQLSDSLACITGTRVAVSVVDNSLIIVFIEWHQTKATTKLTYLINQVNDIALNMINSEHHSITLDTLNVVNKAIERYVTQCNTK